MINRSPEHQHEDKEPTGTLLDISLTDVLQVLSVNRKTCTLFLKKDGERGEIYLKEGKIIDAKAGELKGEQALFYLLNWEGADFFIGTSVEDSVSIRIEKDLHLLILDWIEQRETGREEVKVKPAAVEKGEEKPALDDDTRSFLRKLEEEGIIKAVK